MYFEMVETRPEFLTKNPKEILGDLIAYALSFCKIKDYIGTDVPTVMTWTKRTFAVYVRTPQFCVHRILHVYCQQILFIQKHYYDILDAINEVFLYIKNEIDSKNKCIRNVS